MDVRQLVQPTSRAVRKWLVRVREEARPVCLSSQLKSPARKTSTPWKHASVRHMAFAFLGLSIFFVPMAIMRTAQELEIVQQAGAYRPASFEVVENRCFGGQQNTSRSGEHTSIERTRCSVQGLVEGASEELLISADRVEEFPPGSKIGVWYAPQLEAFGVDGQNLRLQWDHGVSPLEQSRAALWVWPRAFAWMIFWLVVVDRLYVYAGRTPWSSGQLVVAGKSAAPIVGYAFGALGLVFLVGGVRNLSAAAALVGVVIGAIGMPFAFRPIATVDRGAGKVRRRRAFGPITFPTGSVAIPDIRRVIVNRPGRDESLPSLEVSLGRKRSVLLRTDQLDQLRQGAQRLAEALGVSVEDRTFEQPDNKSEQEEFAEEVALEAELEADR